GLLRLSMPKVSTISPNAVSHLPGTYIKRGETAIIVADAFPEAARRRKRERAPTLMRRPVGGASVASLP
ncbi:hypothetical protein CH339_18415, partial [Rhodobium orientis]